MSREDALTWLARHRNRDGSWGYLPKQPGRPEPTLFAAAAGAGVELAWLAEADLGWTRLLLPAALAAVPGAEAMRREVAAGVLEHEVWAPEERSPIFDHDTLLRGWSWVENTASWVEPTAYAILSLKGIGLGGHQRVREGETLILDRQCDDGGWNYGNNGVFGESLPSFLGPTGWACLALPPSAAVGRALARLGQARAAPSATSLAMAILARVAHGAPVEDLPDLLLARQETDGSFNDGRADLTALAALALGAVEEGSHVFDLTT